MAKEAKRDGKGSRTLAIDIGGTGLKASVLDAEGKMLHDRVRIETPVGSPPPAIVEALANLVAPLPAYDRVSVGFPGVVRNGRVRTAANLGHLDLPDQPAIGGVNELVLKKVWAALERARLRYRPGSPFDGQLVLVRTTVPERWAATRLDDPLRGWAR